MIPRLYVMDKAELKASVTYSPGSPAGLKIIPKDDALLGSRRAKAYKFRSQLLQIFTTSAGAE